jgi:hypothetical protein
MSPDGLPPPSAQMIERAALVLLARLRLGTTVVVQGEDWTKPILDDYALSVESQADGSVVIRAVRIVQQG